MIGAYSCEKGLFAAQTYETTINKQTFVDWIKEHLLQHLKTGMMVIMDNAPWHKGDDIRELIESTGAKLLKLPPYSTDLNPIKKAWANLKSAIKKAKKTIPDIRENINLQIKNMEKIKM
ncbi:MAG: transposase [Pseudomonadota bacterium]